MILTGAVLESLVKEFNILDSAFRCMPCNAKTEPKPKDREKT